MALLVRPVAAGAGRMSLLAIAATCAACGAGELGSVELVRAEIDREGESSARSMTGWMFSSRQGGRVGDDGLLLYFELELDGGSVAEVELDLPERAGAEAGVRYVEVRDGRPTFESDRAAGVIEYSADVDGEPCACSGGRFALRIEDFGDDGERGTADDAVRELREGVYGWETTSCGALDELAIDLARSDAVAALPVDLCAEAVRPARPDDGLSSGRPVEPERYSRRDPYQDHDHDPDVDVIYVGGCGGSTREDEASGCDSGSSSSGTSSSSGCDGDDSASSGSSGCDDGDTGGGSSGCDGDDSGAGSGCDGDAVSGFRPRPRRHPLEGPLQNYLWIALASLVPALRKRR